MLNRFRHYGFWGSIRLVRDVIITFLSFPSARLVRYPFYFRGAGKMQIGKRFTTGVGVRLDAIGQGGHPCLVIGNNVQFNDYVHIGALERVEIGDDVLIASRVFISDHNHGNYDLDQSGSHPEIPPIARPLKSRPILIERNVWIGEQVCILSGVTVGEGSIIGASSVVTRNIPPRSIAVGNPARVIRTFDEISGKWVRE